MKKQILPIILGIFLLATASALTIYGGETHYQDLTSEIENLQSFECNLTSQNYNLNGTNFTMNSTGWILSLDYAFKPDNLTIDCLLNGLKEVVTSTGSGGGSHHSNSNTKKEIECSDYGACINGTAIRVCGEEIQSIGCYKWEKPNTNNPGNNKENQTNENNQNNSENKVEKNKNFFQKIWNWIKSLFSIKRK